MKNKVGRPKKTVAETLPKNWKKIILKEMANGASKTEIKAIIVLEMRKNDPDATLSSGLFWRWVDEDKEFLETIKEGERLSKAWWLGKPRQHLEYLQGKDNMKLDTALWFINMKNRFGWRDKQDVTSDGEKIDSLYGLLSTNRKAEGKTGK